GTIDDLADQELVGRISGRQHGITRAYLFGSTKYLAGTIISYRRHLTYDRAMADDATDRLLSGWESARPDLEVGALQVTARLARIGPHLARRQEAIFSRFGLNRGEVGALSALRIAGPPHQLSPTQLGRGLMLSSAGVTSRIDRLERRGYVRRLPDPNDRRGVIIELTQDG